MRAVQASSLKRTLLRRGHGRREYALSATPIPVLAISRGRSGGGHRLLRSVGHEVVG